MQYTKIPKTICDEIEKIQRGFVWGDSDQRRKAHLVSWDVCCLPKMQGGLGFKRPHHMNEAFLMKMIWNLIKQPDKLWCKVLYSKYGRTNDLNNSISSQPYDSPLWKEIVEMWDDFKRRVIWQIGDGRSTNFWLDKWVSSNTSLLSSANQSYVDTTASVRDALNTSGD